VLDPKLEAKQIAAETYQNEKETKKSENPHVDGSSLPFPQTPSASVAGRTLAESDHHWRQDPKRLPEDAPNIVIFMSDDAGFSNPDTFADPGSPADGAQSYPCGSRRRSEGLG
jgi:hypothetical protein